MLVVLGPLTIRNYLLTNRLIFVNAQGGVALWGSTVEKLPQDNVDDPWKIIWYRHGMPIFSKITGSSTYKSRLFYKNILKLNQEFKKQAIANILHRPDIYFHNIIRNFILFTFGNSKGMIIRFIMIQPINEKQSQHFFSQLRTQKIPENVLPVIEEIKGKRFLNRREINQAIKRKIGVEQYYKLKKQLYNCFLNEDLLAVTILYKMITGVLTLLGILGICVAIYKKGTALLIPVMIFFSFCIAHSITYSNYRYLYIKIPFLIIFYGYLMDRTEMYRIKIPILNKQCPIYIICHILMFSWSIGTTFALMSAV